MSALTVETKVKVSPRVYARAFGDELVLLDFGLGEYFGLDPIGAEVWQGIEAGRSIGEVVEHIVATYEVAHDDAVRDVISLVDDLRANALVETT